MQDVCNLKAEFTWNFAKEYYIEAENNKRYIWESPNYGGNNRFTETTLTYEEWIGKDNFGRYKGIHIIGAYTGMFH